jgi:hypothetical protein
LGSVLVAVQGVLMLSGIPLTRSVAVISVLAVLLGGFAPGLSARLSGLRLQPLPGNSEQLQEGIEPHDASHVLASTALAAQYVTWLYVAIGVIYVGCLTGLSLGHDWPFYALVLVLGLLALLQGRSLGGVAQRLAVTLPGVYGVALFCVGLSLGIAPVYRFVVVVAALVLVTILAIASWTVPGRRMLPHWGHAANMLHSALAVSLLPLVLFAFGAFHTLRSIF